MNNSFARLVQGMNHTLRSEVLPRVDDEYARGQVWGLINLLNTFEQRADWSTGFLLQQLQAQRAALDEVAALLASLQPAVTAPDPAPAGAPLQATCAPASVAECLAQRDTNNQAIAALLSELDGAAGTDVSAPLRSQAIAVLRRAMRTEVELELQHSPRPLFAQMSGATE
jgi:hypothetical protein